MADWVDGRVVLVGLTSSYPSYAVYDQDGLYGVLNCQQDLRSFPFAIGDYVMAECTLHRSEFTVSEINTRRVSPLALVVMKIVLKYFQVYSIRACRVQSIKFKSNSDTNERTEWASCGSLTRTLSSCSQ